MLLFTFFGVDLKGRNFGNYQLSMFSPILSGWPENTDPPVHGRPTDPVHGLPYGPVHGPLWRTHPRYGPRQKIAKKENKQKYKQKWQKDLTYHLNGLTACVGENSNVYFCKVNRLGCKVYQLHISLWQCMKDHERPMCFKFAYCSPLPFCSAQSPVFPIMNSTQASWRTTRLVAAMDDRWEFVTTVLTGWYF